MAEILPPFPDIELAVHAMLEETGARRVTSLPEAYNGEGEIILIQRVGGNDNGVTDFPRVAITTFAPERARSRQLSEEVRQRVLASGRTRWNGATIDSADTETAPVEGPPIMDARALPAVYRFSLRRPRS